MAKSLHQMRIGHWEAPFPTDESCRAYFADYRSPQGATRPSCGNLEVGEHGTRFFSWQCYQCSEKRHVLPFSVLAGTIFENTKYPMPEWFRAIHMMLTSKNPVSAFEVHRVIGTGSYRTARRTTTTSWRA